MRPLALLVVLVGICGCEFRLPLSVAIDQKAFKSLGYTYFHDPEIVTSKEIHLDDGSLFGRDVVFEGNIDLEGEHGTHLVVSDKTGKVLVVLFDVIDAVQFLADAGGHSIRVWGTIERGKKGLPYILARSLAVPDKSESAYKTAS